MLFKSWGSGGARTRLRSPAATDRSPSRLQTPPPAPVARHPQPILPPASDAKPARVSGTAVVAGRMAADLARRFGVGRASREGHRVHRAVAVVAQLRQRPQLLAQVEQPHRPVPAGRRRDAAVQAHRDLVLQRQQNALNRGRILKTLGGCGCLRTRPAFSETRRPLAPLPSAPPLACHCAAVARRSPPPSQRSSNSTSRPSAPQLTSRTPPALSGAASFGSFLFFFLDDVFVEVYAAPVMLRIGSSCSFAPAPDHTGRLCQSIRAAAAGALPLTEPRLPAPAWREGQQRHRAVLVPR